MTHTMQWAVCLLVIIFLPLSVAGQSVNTEVRIQTPYGRLLGVRSTAPDGFYYDTYLGIPFAKPPVDALRFRKPEAPEKWRGERDARQKSTQCPQNQNVFPQAPSLVTSPNNEDCLYLNVYTPRLERNGSLLPVMVWIHGGGFAFGSGNNYNGSQLTKKGVVVVTINYRLGVLGFLSTEDDASPGNYGLMDQIRALEWVRDVISAFNGDPKNVTIFGVSAGGTSVTLLQMTYGAKGLYHKAIAQSGPSLLLLGNFGPRVCHSALEKARSLSRKVGCAASNDSRTMVNCLRSKKVSALLDASKISWSMWEGELSILCPVQDTGGHIGLFNDTTENLLIRARDSQVPTMRGFTSEEIGLFPADTWNDGVTLAEFRKYLNATISNFLSTSKVTSSHLAALLSKAYLKGVDVTDPKLLRHILIRLITDMMFIGSTWREMEMLSGASDIPHFLYRFSYRSANNFLPAWKGVVHGAEVPYVFGQPLVAGSLLSNIQFVDNYTQQDRQVSERVMTMWTHFAKHGTLTKVAGEDWAWTTDSPNYIEINTTTTLITDPRSLSPHMTLWTRVFPELLRGKDAAGGAGGEELGWGRSLMALMAAVVLARIIF